MDNKSTKHRLEVPIQEDAFSQLGKEFRLELTGWGNQATVYRIAERVGEDSRRATGKVLKVVKAPDKRDEQYNLIHIPREEQITILQEIAREIKRQRDLLTNHFDRTQQGKLPGLPNLIPEIGPPVISFDEENNPILCVEQEDLDPTQQPFEETYAHSTGHQQPDAPLKTIYSLEPQSIQKMRQTFFELALFVMRVKTFNPKLRKDEDLMLHPKNVCVSNKGHLCLPDILTIEESRAPQRLTSSMGVAFMEEGLLRRPINLKDPYYHGVAEYMQQRECPTVEEAFCKYFNRFI